MAMIDMLRQVPGMESILQIYDTVNEMDDKYLNEDTYPNILQALKEGVSAADTPAAIDSMIRGYRSQSLTKEEVNTQTKEIDNLFKQIVDEFETDNHYKKQLLIDTFNTLYGLMEMAAAEYFVEDIKIYFELLNKGAKIPTYAHPGDAGADIYCPEDVDIPANARGHIIPTGFKMAMPVGWEMQIRPRSGMSVKTKLRVSNTPGTIDAGYRDEVGVIVDNLSSKPIHISAGDRIAQAVIKPVYNFLGVQVDDVSTIGENRGGGFGSTGA